MLVALLSTLHKILPHNNLYITVQTAPQYSPTFITVVPLPTAASPPTESGLQAKQSSVVHYSAAQCSAMDGIAVQCSVVQCCVLQYWTV